jgi:hypothetical protein
MLENRQLPRKAPHNFRKRFIAAQAAAMRDFSGQVVPNQLYRIISVVELARSGKDQAPACAGPVSGKGSSSPPRKASRKRSRYT